MINPGNPTGQVLDEANMREIVSLCKERGICLMADEVYQENIWKPGARFVSFRKIAMDMGLPAEASSDEGNNFQLISFHSISKVSEKYHVALSVCYRTASCLSRCLSVTGLLPAFRAVCYRTVSCLRKV